MKKSIKKSCLNYEINMFYFFKKLLIQMQNCGTNLLGPLYLKYSYLLGVYSFGGLIFSFSNL